MFNAIAQRDTSFEGIFVVAVKTTRIFCRPTCKAKSPLRKNVEFFKSSADALTHGYKPCQRCLPIEKEGDTPDYIKKALGLLANNPLRKIKDSDLRLQGIEPVKIRRWFKNNHGITFQSYQRMLRINTAFEKIKNGEPVTSVAFDAGYESLSGFSDSFKTVIGTSPINSKEKSVINFIRFESPVGALVACATSEGICLLEFADRRMLETELKQLCKLLHAPIVQGSNKYFDPLRQQLHEYFEGIRKDFTVPLVTPGTEFQQAVWRQLLKIKYGSTRSYKQVAADVHKPNAVRAVATANGMNRIAIIIPCHRVIGSNGHPTGYGGGIWRKQWLLDLENGVNKLNYK
jgi:AraC family transcriptional regulator of adaptative response/methylated-DNA-[protein]-cysteine methyltransferase